MHARLRIARSVLLTVLIAGTAAFALTSEAVLGIEPAPRLVSFNPLPEMASDSCSWEVAAAETRWQTGLQARQSGAGGAAQTSEPPRFVTFNDNGDAVASPSATAHIPVRFVQDPYPSFSAVRVDSMRNEVVLMDGNRFNVMVYDRLANTASGAAFTPPKRMIGGMKTLSQFPSDVYIDPGNGDLYVPNNDSLTGMNVFARDVQGNVPATRNLKSAPYGSYGITVDEERQELLLTIQHDGAIVAWKKTASGNDAPVRLIQGDRTRLGDPHGIALDPKNKLLYVVNFGTSRQTAQQAMQPDGKPRVPHWPAGNLGLGGLGRYRYEVVNGTGKFDLPSVTVFPKDAEGNVAPLRVIQGPKTQLSWPTGVAVDPEHNEVFVANDTGNSITVYGTAANGDVAPIRVLKGSRTAIKNPTGVFVDVANDELWVANFGDHSATVYQRTASGDTAPIRTIRSAPRNSPATFINNPFAIVYDGRREEVLVPNCVQHPRIAAFPVMADKAALPVRAIEGQNTRLNRTVHSIGYDDIHDEIVVQSNIGQAILTFRGGANGDEAPIRIIQGPKTQLRDPEKLALDPVHNEIFVLNMTVDDEVLVFDRLAQGDVAPKRVLRANGGNLAVDTVHDLLVLTGSGIQIFDRAAGGDAKPLRRIEGGGGTVRVHSPTGMIVTTMRDREGGPYIGVWNVNDSGKVPPRWTVGKGMLKETRGITVDPKNKTIIVSDKLLAGVLTYSLPQMFERVETTTAAR